MRNFLASLGFGLCLALVYLLFSSGSIPSASLFADATSSKSATNSNKNSTSSSSSSTVATSAAAKPSPSQQVQQVYIPSYMDFAGEAVPLADYDIKERLDRELTSITFRHSHTIRILKLANRWFPTIEQILSEHGIPQDFKYLAVAESGLENVISPKDARGFWQFLSSTAKSYGLEVGSDVDERYHIEKSTVAACKYLKKAYEKFGSWPMAAAAYNRGVSGVNTQATNQQTRSYWSLYLNTETYRYIFRILAYKQLMSDPASYGFYFDKSDLYSPIPYSTVEVSSIADVATFARQYGSDYKHIKLLNPWMKTKYVKAKSGKKYEVKIPTN